MAVLDRLPGRRDRETVTTGGKVPKQIDERLKRGKKAAMKDAPKRKVGFRFYRNDQYCWVNEKNQISTSPTITHTTGGGKEPHRVRTTRNFAKQIIEGKISKATNATPGYEVSPTSTDPSAASAAKTAQKVAVYGYDKWSLRRHRVKLVTNALVADGGFIMPYFDPNVGPYVPDPDDPSKSVGYGEIKIRVYNGSQVAWEPGVDFEDSPWWATMLARPISEIEARPGFTGDKLTADATTQDVPTDRPTENMALEVEYFERPSPDRPRGRKLVIVNDRVITPEEDYPLLTPDGEVCDEPVLHRLEYTLDADADRGMGLMEHLRPSQETLNDCVSKAIEWKNRVLVPQFKARKGSLVRGQMFDDAPGRIYWTKGTTVNDDLQVIPTPPIPRELFTMADQEVSYMQALAAEPDTLTATTAAPGTLQAIQAQAAQSWTTFLAALADVDAAVMRHALYLVQRFYTEPRLLELKGRWDWDNIEDFKGADLLGQCSVRVDKSSLHSRGRQEVKEDIQFWQTNYPGAVPVEAAMAAYYGGVGDNLMLDYRLDIARAHEVIRAIRSGPDALHGRPMEIRVKVDEATGQVGFEEVPWQQPGPSDNVRVWKALFGSFMKTNDYQMLIPEMKVATQEVYNQLLVLEMQQAARQQAMQTQMAEQLGRANAASPQGEELPSQPAVANQAGGTGASNGASAG